jgi:dihydrofolate reductase
VFSSKEIKMIISHIVAVSKNWVIGKNSGLPWKMPSDAQYFHDVTMGHIVIMGRKNYEANKKALPGRLNIVITRREDFKTEDAVTVKSINEALEVVKSGKNPDFNVASEIFIVGGGEIYRQTLDIADRIYITVIDAVVDGDTYYPKIDFSNYNILSEQRHAADDKNPYDWTYYILEPLK